MVVTIRMAVEEDLEFLAQANLNLAWESESLRLDPEKSRSGVLAVLRDPSLGNYHIAEENGQPRGSLLVTTEWSDWRNGFFWWIQSVYVDPSARRRGIYSALYETILARANHCHNVCGIRLYVDRNNAHAIAVYRRSGMTETPYLFFERDCTNPSMGERERDDRKTE